uniref:NR LBD domain-containing protein n=1 Tax=Plectus sambesii TaxID=2011161 RepID=A0A914XQW6_9BILA
MEYAKSMDPFLQLPPDQKLEFFKAFSCIWGGIEGSFRTVKAGGFEKRWLVMPDNSYVVLDDLQGYYEGDVLKVDKQTAARLFKPAGEQALAEIMLPMVQNKMNDVEFVTLAAITSWTCDPTLSNCSEETKTLGKITRDQLCADLYAYYANVGIPDPDVRFGNLLLMIPALLEFARTSLENFRLVKFFDMMNYDKILDDLFD